MPILLKKLAKAYGQMPSAFASDPVETFRDHVWVAPFYEDDLSILKEELGLDHILFGSDWPHAEGLAEPRPSPTTSAATTSATRRSTQ